MKKIREINSLAFPKKKKAKINRCCNVIFYYILNIDKGENINCRYL